MEAIGSICKQSAIALAVAVVVGLFGLNRQTQTAAPVHITNVIGAAGPQDVQATIYGAEWCGPCRVYKKSVLEKLPPDGWIVRKAAEKDAANAHVLIEQDETKFATANVHSIPCTIIRKNGKEVDRFIGPITPDALVERINKARGKK